MFLFFIVQSKSPKSTTINYSLLQYLTALFLYSEKMRGQCEIFVRDNMFYSHFVLGDAVNNSVNSKLSVLIKNNLRT